MNLSPRVKLVLTGVVTLLVVVLAAAALIVPQVTHIMNLQSQTEKASDELAQARNLLSARQGTKKNAVFVDASSLELISAVPENPDLPSLIIELQDKAYENKVQLREIQPENPVANEGFSTIPIRMTIWGTWQNTVNFVQGLPKLGRQIRIVSVRVGILGEEAGKNDAVTKIEEKYSVKTDLIIETYIIPSEGGTSASVPSPSASTQPESTTDSSTPTNEGR